MYCWQTKISGLICRVDVPAFSRFSCSARSFRFRLHCSLEVTFELLFSSNTRSSTIPKPPAAGCWQGIHRMNRSGGGQPSWTSCSRRNWILAFFISPDSTHLLQSFDASAGSSWIGLADSGACTVVGLSSLAMVPDRKALDSRPSTFDCESVSHEKL